MPTEGQHQLSIIERIERALVLLAYFIELDGDVHLPMYEKFEAELEEYKQALATRERARRRLASYTEGGAAKLVREQVHMPAQRLPTVIVSEEHAT